MKLDMVRKGFREFKRAEETRWTQVSPTGFFVYAGTDEPRIVTDEDMDADDWVPKEMPIPVTRMGLWEAYIGAYGTNLLVSGRGDTVFNLMWKQLEERHRASGGLL